jgi:hypothetical protein
MEVNWEGGQKSKDRAVPRVKVWEFTGGVS